MAREIKGFRFVDILKAGEDEAVVLTGATSPEEGARRLSLLGPREVIVTLGSQGSLVFTEGRLYRIPAYKPGKLVDATGCGDTYLAGYLIRRLEGADVEACGRFGAALATLKMEGYGPFTGSRRKVEALISRARALEA